MKFDKNPNDGTNSADYLKIKDGESIVGVFQGEPLEYYGKWEQKKMLLVTEGENGARFRFRINFVTKEQNVYVSKIWDQGAKVYNQLKALHNDYPLNNTVIKITRSGTGTNTNYSILPIPGGSEIHPETKKMLDAVDLYDLGEHLKNTTSANTPSEDMSPFPDYESGEPNWASNEEIPF